MKTIKMGQADSAFLQYLPNLRHFLSQQLSRSGGRSLHLKTINIIKKTQKKQLTWICLFHIHSIFISTYAHYFARMWTLTFHNMPCLGVLQLMHCEESFSTVGFETDPWWFRFTRLNSWIERNSKQSFSDHLLQAPNLSDTMGLWYSLL